MVMLHASFGRMNAYIIQSAWAFFVAYPCTMGNAKAWKCGISDRYSSHAFFVVNLFRRGAGRGTGVVLWRRK